MPDITPPALTTIWIGDQTASNRIAWTSELVEWLKSVYADTANQDILNAVPGLTAVALSTKAYELRLRKTPAYRKAYLSVNRESAIAKLRGSIPWNKEIPVSIVCKVCGVSFGVPACRADKVLCCSRRCIHEWKRQFIGDKNWNFKEKSRRLCQWCGAAFECKPAKVKYGEGKFCSRSCLGSHSVRKQGGRRSGLEIIVEAELKRRGIPYDAAVKVKRWNVDFLVYPNRIIECDGTYWHSLPKVMERDARKTADLAAVGYKVIRLGESEIRQSVRDAVDSALK